MTEPRQEGFRTSRSLQSGGAGSGANLADILERVLDKGIVIAGDIQVNLLDIELLTIKLRLLVASVDKAKEMGIDWWEHDPSLSSHAVESSRVDAERTRTEQLQVENDELRNRLAALEEASQPHALEEEGATPARSPARPRRQRSTQDGSSESRGRRTEK